MSVGCVAENPSQQKRTRCEALIAYLRILRTTIKIAPCKRERESEPTESPEQQQQQQQSSPPAWAYAPDKSDCEMAI